MSTIFFLKLKLVMIIFGLSSLKLSFINIC